MLSTSEGLFEYGCALYTCECVVAYMRMPHRVCIDVCLICVRDSCTMSGIMQMREDGMAGVSA